MRGARQHHGKREDAVASRIHITKSPIDGGALAPVDDEDYTDPLSESERSWCNG